jgi:hypothetical protein
MTDPNPSPTSQRIRPTSRGTPQVGVGSIVGKTFTIWKRYLPVFAVIGIVTQTIAYTLGIAIYESGLRDYALQFAVRALDLTLSEFVSSIYVYSVLQHIHGSPVDFAKSVRVALGRLVPVTIAALVTGILTGIGIVLFIIPGIVIACMFFVTQVVVVAENAGPFAAMQRSLQLTRGNRLNVFGVSLVLGLLVGIPAAIVSVGLAAVVNDAVILGFIYCPVIGFLSSLVPVSVTVAYHELRTRVEGTTTQEIVAVFE